MHPNMRNIPQLFPEIPQLYPETIARTDLDFYVALGTDRIPCRPVRCKNKTKFF